MEKFGITSKFFLKNKKLGIEHENLKKCGEHGKIFLRSLSTEEE